MILGVLKQTFFLFTALLFLSHGAFGDEGTVAPELTDSQIRTATSPHFYANNTKLDNGLLLITFAGTNSMADQLLPFARTAVAVGYHAIGIDYINSVITTDCRGKADHQCFEKFRREIDFGDQVSDLVDVSPTNCILNRIEKLLRYLVQHQPNGKWQQFLKNDKPDWEKIVLAGHSQGAGHAAFFAKTYRVRGAICLAGPQDGDTWGIASWVLKPGLTPGARYSALLHKNDFYKSEIQIAAVRGLTGDEKSPVFYFSNLVPPDEHSSILVSTLEVKNPHMSVIGEEFKPVWNHLLKSFEVVKTARAK